MADDFIGKYTMDSIDNWDSLMRELGATDELLAKISNITEGTLEISKDGNVYTMNAVSPVISRETKFELGQEFDEKHLDGTPVKSIIVVEGNKLIQTTHHDGKELIIIRELSGNQINVTATYGSIVAKSTYVKI